ncbi:MAG: type II secretion system protein, partial [Betaproteobacteria bacterium]|nr:type II secretion system protein [Betaproteobacteria bacterium]
MHLNVRRNLLFSPRHRQRACGFTLVELVVTISIVGLLAAIVVPRLVG